MDKANRPIKALLTMNDIVTTLERDRTMTVTAVAEEVDRPSSVVHDYLSTLRELGYVIQDDSGAYKLSLRYLEVGGRVRDHMPLYKVAKPEVNTLAEKTSNEFVTLSVEQNGICVALDVVQNDLSISYDFTDGTHFHMHSSAVGKAILAQYPDERVTEILNRHGLPAHTESTITEREDLEEEFDQIRENGVSFDREEYRVGMASISTTIGDTSGNVVGGLSITGPAHRLREPEIQGKLQKDLLSAKNVIELNYSSSDATN